MKRKTIFLVLTCLFLDGCTYSQRHPKLTKYGLIGAGIAGGVAIGVVTTRHSCHYTYDGQPYFGTTCPAPKELKSSGAK